MSNRNPDSSYDQLEQALSFCFSQEAKNIHTSVPGVIQAYDPMTKRAEVQIALKTLIGTPEEHEAHDRPVILDVPILHPSGGGYVIHLPLAAGDAVMLLFAERGIEKFKTTFEISEPTMEAFFMERDAVAIPGFGAMEITPAGDGLTIQTEDGAQFIHITAEGDMTVTSTQSLTINAPTVTINSTTTVINSAGGTATFP